MIKSLYFSTFLLFHWAQFIGMDRNSFCHFCADSVVASLHLSGVVLSRFVSPFVILLLISCDTMGIHLFAHRFVLCFNLVLERHVESRDCTIKGIGQDSVQRFFISLISFVWAIITAGDCFLANTLLEINKSHKIQCSCLEEGKTTK